MTGFEQHLGLYMWEDPLWNAVLRCGAFGVSGGGGETPMVVSGVKGDIGVSSAADLLCRKQGCKPIVWYVLRGRGWVDVLRGGGEGLYGVPCSYGSDACI